MRGQAIHQTEFNILAVSLCGLDQDIFDPLGIWCRQHPSPGSDTVLPPRPALPCFVVDECQVRRSPCLLQGFKEQHSLAKSFSRFAGPCLSVCRRLATMSFWTAYLDGSGTTTGTPLRWSSIVLTGSLMRKSRKRRGPGWYCRGRASSPAGRRSRPNHGSMSGIQLGSRLHSDTPTRPQIPIYVELAGSWHLRPAATPRSAADCLQPPG